MSEEVLDQEILPTSDSLALIRRNCFLVYVRVHRWPGQYVIRGATVELENNEVDAELTTAPRWRFVPASWSKRLQNVSSRIRAVVKARATGFYSGIYIVPRAVAQAFMDDLDVLRRRYQEVAREFAEAWPAIRLEVGNRVASQFGEEVWEKASKVLPKNEDVASLFDIETGLWPISGGTMDGNQSFMEGDEMFGYLDQARRTTQTMLNNAVGNMLTEPLREFAASIQALQDVQANDGSIRNSTLEAMRRAHAKLLSFEFMVPSELVQRLRDVSDSLNLVDARDVNQRTEASEALTNELADIRNELNEAARRAPGSSGQRRSVIIDD